MAEIQAKIEINLFILQTSWRCVLYRRHLSAGIRNSRRCSIRTHYANGTHRRSRNWARGLLDLNGSFSHLLLPTFELWEAKVL